MKWKKFISESLQKNLNEEQIAEELINSEELYSELKSVSELEILEEIQKQKKLVEVKKAMQVKEEIKEEKKEAVDIKAVVEESVREAFKSVNLNSSAYSQQIKESFNFRTGKMEKFDSSAEYKRVVNDLALAISTGDASSAKAINDEIESSRKTTTTGYVSDVANRGGYLVPAEYETMINSLQYGAEKIANLMRGVAVSANSRIYPVMAQLDAYWRASQSEIMVEQQTAVSERSLDKKNLYILASVSNTLLRQRVDISDALAAQMAEAFARRIDLTVLAGAVTADSDKFNGLIFDSQSNVISSAVDLSDLSVDYVDKLYEDKSIYSITEKLIYVANTRVLQKIKRLKNASGQAEYPNSAEGRPITPNGVKFIEAPILPNTIDFSGGSKAGGSQTALLLVDTSNVFIDRGGISLDVSDQNKFGSDMTLFRGIRDVGLMQLFQNRTVVLKINANE